MKTEYELPFGRWVRIKQIGSFYWRCKVRVTYEPRSQASKFDLVYKFPDVESYHPLQFKDGKVVPLDIIVEHDQVMHTLKVIKGTPEKVWLEYVEKKSLNTEHP